jgi:hypothetical protein
LHNSWCQLLGKLCSMACAIPEAHCMFFILQNMLMSQTTSNHLSLSPLVYATLKDGNTLPTCFLCSTPLSHLVPTALTFMGTYDAFRLCMDGIWFPVILAHSLTNPTIWHHPFQF